MVVNPLGGSMMKAIETKVQVNADHTATVQLPIDVPMGEYDAVLVLSQRSDSAAGEESSHTEGEQTDSLMTEAWEQWVEEVEKLPLSPNPIQEGDFQEYLVEKHRKQGLVL
jgi:hypothetical protein